MVSTTLGSALEAVGRFRWILTTHLITFGIQAVGAVYAIMLADWLPVLLALAGSNIVNHTLQVTLCATSRVIDSSRLLAGYFTAAVAAAVLAGCTWGIISAFGGAVNLWVGVASGIALLVGGLLSWRYRHGLPPLRILGQYRPR
jgi:L-cysteine desulfidase